MNVFGLKPATAESMEQLTLCYYWILFRETEGGHTNMMSDMVNDKITDITVKKLKHKLFE